MLGYSCIYGEEMKCPKCGWEGEDSELIEVPADLRVEDHFFSATFVMAIKRSSFLCPSCRTTVKNVKYFYGREAESEIVR